MYNNSELIHVLIAKVFIQFAPSLSIVSRSVPDEWDELAMEPFLQPRRPERSIIIRILCKTTTTKHHRYEPSYPPRILSTSAPAALHRALRHVRRDPRPPLLLPSRRRAAASASVVVEQRLGRLLLPLEVLLLHLELSEPLGVLREGVLELDVVDDAVGDVLVGVLLVAGGGVPRNDGVLADCARARTLE